MVQMTATDDDLVAWLLQGDPSIRWRVHRDLIGSSASTVRAERANVATEGWGAKLLSFRVPTGAGAVVITPPSGSPRRNAPSPGLARAATGKPRGPGRM